MNPDRLVTIRTFTYPHESGVPRSLLESEGIECFMRDEMTANIQPFYSNAIGGIKLQVRESDAQRAIEILTEGGFINSEERKDLLGEEEKVADGTDCPYCGSAEVVEKKSAFAAMLSMLLLGFPVPTFRKGYHCMDCGKDFKKKR